MRNCEVTTTCVVFYLNKTQAARKATGSHISAVIYSFLQQRGTGVRQKEENSN